MRSVACCITCSTDDSSRVRLPIADPTDAGDYINASYITYPVMASTEGTVLTNCRYIATQDPLSSTVADFWTMIWDQKVTTVVSLTSADVTAAATLFDATADVGNGNGGLLCIPNDINQPLVIAKRLFHFSANY